MTREGAKALLPIIQAYSEGKTVEYLTTRDKWVELEDPGFNYNAGLYRIKPEPRYRSFRSTEECFEEMKKHEPFGWLKSKSENYKTSIIDVDFKYIGINNNCHTYEYAFSNFEFIDGTPFGIKED